MEGNDGTGQTAVWLNIRSTRRSDTEHPELIGGTTGRRRPPVAGPLTRRYPLSQRNPVPDGAVLDQVAADGGWRTARWWREPPDE